MYIVWGAPGAREFIYYTYILLNRMYFGGIYVPLQINH